LLRSLNARLFASSQYYDGKRCKSFKLDFAQHCNPIIAATRDCSTLPSFALLVLEAFQLCANEPNQKGAAGRRAAEIAREEILLKTRTPRGGTHERREEKILLEERYLSSFHSPSS
jgi:hypothetical protein